jgi:phytanoyl-CoA hydroxylase
MYIPAPFDCGYNVDRIGNLMEGNNVTTKFDAVLSDEQKKQFSSDGFLVAKGLLAEEIHQMREHFMDIHARAPIANYHPKTAEEAQGDILKQYPRIMHPHRFDEQSKMWMIQPKLAVILTDLFGEEPIAAQSMFYFKPPGSKGQALHQDNFYLLVEPNTCIAAWVAVDDADEGNGGMFVVPQSGSLEVFCPHKADPAVSFTVHEVDVPEGMKAVPVPMKAGDVLFFNGSAIHGSYPNTSKDRFRRAFICHYTARSTTKISRYYNPMIAMDGSELHMTENMDGGPCGPEYKGGVH